jgi:hypothetical protein
MVQHDVHWQLPYWVIKPNQLMMVSTHTIISKMKYINNTIKRLRFMVNHYLS